MCCCCLKASSQQQQPGASLAAAIPPNPPRSRLPIQLHPPARSRLRLLQPLALCVNQSAHAPPVCIRAAPAKVKHMQQQASLAAFLLSSPRGMPSVEGRARRCVLGSHTPGLACVLLHDDDAGGKPPALISISGSESHRFVLPRPAISFEQQHNTLVQAGKLIDQPGESSSPTPYPLCIIHLSPCLAAQKHTSPMADPPVRLIYFSPSV